MDCHDKLDPKKMMQQAANDSFTTMLYFTLISNVTNTLVSSITGIIQYVSNKTVEIYNYIYEYLLEKIYGPKIELTGSITACIHDSYPSIASAYMEHLEKEHGINIKKYIQENHDNIKAQPVTCGDKKIGIVLSSTEIKRDSGSFYVNSYTFYSRYHTKQTIKELATNIYRTSHKYITGRGILIRDDVNGDINNNYYPLTNVPDKIFVTDAYEEMKKIILDKDQANIMLHGPPGTGKTNIIKKLTHDLEAILIIINPVKFRSIERLRRFMNKESFCTDRSQIIMPKRKFFLFEDFDTTMPNNFWCNPVSSNTETNETEEASPKPPSTANVQYTYSDLLNLLDGVIKIPNVYMFFTTNHLEKFPKSFYRPGRMHYKVCIDLLTISQMAQFIDHYYGPDQKNAKEQNAKEQKKTAAAKEFPTVKMIKKIIVRRTTISEMYAIKDLAKDYSDFIEKINKKYLDQLEGKDTEVTTKK